MPRLVEDYYLCYGSGFRVRVLFKLDITMLQYCLLMGTKIHALYLLGIMRVSHD